MRDDHITLSEESARPSAIKYRLVVGGIGKVYDGGSRLEAKRRFRLFNVQSKTPKSRAAGEPVTLFREYAIIKEYHPLESFRNLQHE